MCLAVAEPGGAHASSPSRSADARPEHPNQCRCRCRWQLPEACSVGVSVSCHTPTPNRMPRLRLALLLLLAACASGGGAADPAAEPAQTGGGQTATTTDSPWPIKTREHVDLWLHGFAMITQDTTRVPYFRRGYRDQLTTLKNSAQVTTQLDANRQALNARLTANRNLVGAQFLALYFGNWKEMQE